MHSIGAPTASLAKPVRPPVIGRTSGLRAVIDFAPKPTSNERLCAGVVTRTEDGTVSFACAIDPRKAEHAFGDAGAALYAIAHTLCTSLTEHWQTQEDIASWVPPFERAQIADYTRFSGRTVAEAHTSILNRTSTMHTLLATYEIVQDVRLKGIVERVKTAIARDINNKHMAKRFNRYLPLGDKAQPMKVDFLGQNFACYFLQITHSARGLESNADRAFARLYELQALRMFIKKPKKSLGLLDDEKPDTFELMMVGDRNDSIQRRAIYQVEALADKKEVIARAVPTVLAAAEHLATKERLVA